MKHRYLHVFLAMTAALLPLSAHSQSIWLTATQFKNQDAGAFIGEVTSIQVTSSNQYSESGTVQMSVTSVIAGSLSADTVSFAYTRALVPTDDAANWDLIAPAYTSLKKIAIDRSFLVYFTQAEGVYSLAAAGNAVQDVNDGLLLGTLHFVEGKKFHDRDKKMVQIDVIETVYGTASGAQITLPLDLQTPRKGWGFGRLSLQRPVDVADKIQGEDGEQYFEGQKVFISFDKSGVTGIQIATSEQLTELQEADAE